MAITAFRKALAKELEDSAHAVLIANGRSKRTIEEHRYFTGYADGLQAAADLVMTFMQEDGDSE